MHPKGWLLQWRLAHGEAGEPVAGSGGDGASNNLEAGTFEDGFGAEEDVVCAGALIASAGVGLYGGGAVIEGVLGGGASEGYCDTLASGFCSHSDTGDNPNVFVIYAGGGPGPFNPGQFLAWGNSCPTDGFIATVGKEARGDRASRQFFHGDATSVGT